MTEQAAAFTPPAAEGLPPGVLDSATDGASALDAWAREPIGRNFLAHALVQLARDGWLRTEPGEGFETVRDRETPEPEDASSAVPAPATDQAAEPGPWTADGRLKPHAIPAATSPDVPSMTGGFDGSIEIPELAAGRATLRDRRATCPDREPLLGVQCAKEAGHEVHSDRPGRIWYPAPADRATVLREAADAINEVIEADRAYSPRRSNDRAALGGAREIVLNLIDKPRRMADETQQPETEAAEAPVVCEGFQWIGQSFATCDRCGQPAWDHVGEDVPVEGAGPFDNRRTVRPWAPGQADRIRAKWGTPAAVQQPETGA